MPVYKGKIICDGMAVGTIRVIQKREKTIHQNSIAHPAEEIARFYAAVETAKQQAGELYQKALEEVGEKNAAIFEMHMMLMDDPDFLAEIVTMITNHRVNAEYAVSLTGDSFGARFAAMENEYMKARSLDIKDVTERILQILSGDEGEKDICGGHPSIVLAQDLTPSDTIRLNKEDILAFVTVQGSAYSHTAILAKTLNIPAMYGVDMDIKDMDGKLAVVDAMDGWLYLEPDENTLKEAEEKLKQYHEKKAKHQRLKGVETITGSGRKINLYANIGNPADVAEALDNDAEGIGLLRSEFLYLGRDTYPTEEEQFLAYREVLTKMAGRKVIIRTLDIGADKQEEYFELEREENPAMGYRAIRICLRRKELFKTQLRALLRAGIYGKLSIMYPMIISPGEIRQIKQLLCEAREELEAQGILYSQSIEQGIMIETPAAAMISDLLAKEVDFFSIGTNDLTQYTLAIDRQNASLEYLYDPYHEAVLRLINLVVQNAHKEKLWVGICGELGADTSITKRLIEMGMDEFSVPPGMILSVREAILNS